MIDSALLIAFGWIALCAYWHWVWPLVHDDEDE